MAGGGSGFGLGDRKRGGSKGAARAAARAMPRARARATASAAANIGARAAARAVPRPAVATAGGNGSLHEPGLVETLVGCGAELQLAKCPACTVGIGGGEGGGLDCGGSAALGSVAGSAPARDDSECMTGRQQEGQRAAAEEGARQHVRSDGRNEPRMPQRRRLRYLDRKRRPGRERQRVREKIRSQARSAFTART